VSAIKKITYISFYVASSDCRSFRNPQSLPVRLGPIRNPESEGCLVALAVFKTVVAAQVAGQVRFLSSPLLFSLSSPNRCHVGEAASFPRWEGTAFPYRHQ